MVTPEDEKRHCEAVARDIIRADASEHPAMHVSRLAHAADRIARERAAARAEALDEAENACLSVEVYDHSADECREAIRALKAAP